MRPVNALHPVRTIHKAKPKPATTARFLLVGKPLPRVEDSVRIGELMRMAVMSAAKKQLGEDAVPRIFSGHGLPDGNRHRHAFYLPWDANGDGRIDRLLLHVPNGMELAERRVVEKLRRLWSRDGGEWRVVLEGIGDTNVGGPLMSCATEWESVTAYLHPWHVKKNFNVQDQIRRECWERGMPEPVAFEPLKKIKVGSQPRRSIHFRRFRNKRNRSQPDRLGSFWRLKFAKPVLGPLALGFGCHFGLGLFVPCIDHEQR